MVETIGNRFWIWATVVNALRDDRSGILHDSTMTPAGGMAHLAVPNIVMAGFLPPNDTEASAVQNARRVAWELSLGTREDEIARRPNFAFHERLGRIQDIATRHPNVEAVVLDDLTTLEITHRKMPPSVMADLCFALQSQPRPLSLWGVVYTMSFDIPNLRDYLNFLDVIVLCVWHARDLPQLDAHLQRCNELTGNKPIILCLYMHDWGEHRPMPLDLMELQCEKARAWLHEKRIFGGLLLATSILDIGLPATEWTRRWIAQVRAEPLA